MESSPFATANLSPSIPEFFAGRSVFVTGGSGFIGKQVVEKLLRSCPGISKLYVMLRSNKHHSAVERMQHILSSPLFAGVKSECAGALEKVVVVDGNLEKPNLGINDATKHELLSDVSVVFHLAATVSFNEPLRVAVNLNIVGLRNVLELCKQMSRLESFVHVSTAYANCNRKHITEMVYTPPLQPAQILDAVSWMSDDVLKDISARVLGDWPNTYTFTKTIAEQLLLNERGQMPTAIFRPSIVTATYAEPIPGWVDNYNGCTGVMTAIATGFVKAVYGGRQNVADLVPVDLTANAVIAVAWQTALNKNANEVPVYHFTSGQLNKVSWHQVGSLVTELLNKHPMENPTCIPSGYVTENWLWSVYSKHVDVYLRLCGLDLLRRISGRKPRMLRIHRTVRRMLTLMEYFTSHEWHWTTDNITRLSQALTPADRQLFNFDVRCVSWPEYFELYILGIRQYMMHQDMKSLPSARRLLTGLLWLQRLTVLSLLVFIVRLAMSRVETAKQLWRFTINMCTGLLTHLPHFTHS